MNKDNTYKCDRCKYCDANHGICKLQDYNYCANCATWLEVYGQCPLNKEKQYGRNGYDK